MIFEKINSKNLNEAIKAAKEIFPYEYHDGEFWPEAAYKEAIEKSWYNFAYFVAKVNGEIVGITGFYPPEDDEPEMWLGWFGARPESRGIGYGQQILSQTLKMVRKMGQKRLRLYSGDREEEHPAHRLYIKNGFTISSKGEVDGLPVIYFVARNFNLFSKGSNTWFKR
jgi:GNAT superfamily N-acetyltransferase